MFTTSTLANVALRSRDRKGATAAGYTAVGEAPPNRVAGGGP